MSTEKENKAIASLKAEIDGEADSENLVDDIILTIFGTEVVDQSGSPQKIVRESGFNSASLTAESCRPSENNFAEA